MTFPSSTESEPDFFYTETFRLFFTLTRFVYCSEIALKRVISSHSGIFND